jgi:hypothetical protein
LLDVSGIAASANFVAQVGFLIANDPQPTNAPIVFGLTPHFGPQGGGTSVAVSGLNFDKFGVGPTVGVTVGGAAATGVSVQSNTQLVMNTPPGAMGQADVVVTSSLGSGSKPDGFVYTPAVLSTEQVVLTGKLRVENYGPVGTYFDTWFSPFATSIPLPPFGTILIGPTPIVKFLAGFYPAPNGIHVLEVTVPNDPSLHGVVAHYQTVSVPSFAPLVIQLTNASTTTVL